MRTLALFLLLLALGWTVLPAGSAFAAESPAAEIPIETVETGEFSMDYFRFGEGEKCFVILPGLSVQSVMGSAAAVADAYQMFAEEYTVYLFDRRKELPESYSVHDMARDTAEAIRALGLEDICLFGTSQGGMIALDIAIENPDLVDRLILGSTSACITEESAGVIDEWIALAEAGDAKALYLAFGEAIYPPETFEAAKDLLLTAAETVTEEELSRFVILAAGIRDFDVSAELGKIACPVLAIGSEDDRVLGGDATLQIAQALGARPDFVLYMYEGYGHAAYDTAPDYRDRILGFLAEEAAAA